MFFTKYRKAAAARRKAHPTVVRAAIERCDIPESDIMDAGPGWVKLYNGRIIEVPSR